MERVIKFRGWNIETKQMVDLQKITPLALSIDPSVVGAGVGLYIPNDKRIKIMQFTGLLDKNGKEIYEGDIVKYNFDDSFEQEHPKEYIQKVEFNDGAFIPVFMMHRTDWRNFDDRPQTYFDFEIIGNIYENPELLAEK